MWKREKKEEKSHRLGLINSLCNVQDVMCKKKNYPSQPKPMKKNLSLV